MSRYDDAAHRVQTAIAALMGRDRDYKPTQRKHMRTGIDLSKADQAGLATLLIAKGAFTTEEYIEAITKSAETEANTYEKEVQATFGNPNIKTV